jgi:hypothetical protein
MQCSIREVYVHVNRLSKRSDMIWEYNKRKKSNSPLQEQVERSQCRRIESDDEKIDDEHSAYILLQPL